MQIPNPPIYSTSSYFSNSLLTIPRTCKQKAFQSTACKLTHTYNYFPICATRRGFAHFLTSDQVLPNQHKIQLVIFIDKITPDTPTLTELVDKEGNVCVRSKMLCVLI